MRIRLLRPTSYLGKIFELDAASIRRWEGLAGDRLPAGRVKIPAQPESRYRPYLLTRIEVYGENRLQDYDCSLTPPQPLRGKIEGGGRCSSITGWGITRNSAMKRLRDEQMRRLCSLHA